MQGVLIATYLGVIIVVSVRYRSYNVKVVATRDAARTTAPVAILSPIPVNASSATIHGQQNHLKQQDEDAGTTEPMGSK